MNGSPVARSHPPSMLEWQAAKMRVNMAAECHFPDGMKHSSVSSSILNTGWKKFILKCLHYQVFLSGLDAEILKKFVFLEGKTC